MCCNEQGITSLFFVDLWFSSYLGDCLDNFSCSLLSPSQKLKHFTVKYAVPPKDVQDRHSLWPRCLIKFLVWPFCDYSVWDKYFENV